MDAAWQLVQFLGGKDATGVYYVPKRWALEFGLGFSPAPFYEDEEVRNSISGWIDPDLLKRAIRIRHLAAHTALCPSSPIGRSAVGVRCRRPSSAMPTKARFLNDLAEEWNELKDDWGY